LHRSERARSGVARSGNNSLQTKAFAYYPLGRCGHKLQCMGSPAVKLATWGLALALACATGLHAQDDAASEPPERAGRLAFVEGEVLAWNEQQQAWQPALLNLPVTSRSAFWAGAGGRAEVKIGSAALRLDSESQANLLRLDDGGTDIDVPRGTVSVRLRAPADPAWQVAVRSTILSLASPGLYRVDVDPARGLLVAKVFEGSAVVDAAGLRTPIVAGQQASFDLASQQLAARTAPQRTAFDDWAALRDREQDRLQAWRYVSPEMTGADSLDSAGDWRVDPAYGAVWYPSAVPAGWAPYSYGRWVWMSPWGWTWVDDAPWGFAPFHYGRWILVGSAWGWVPGPYVRRPAFAPALVGFHGNGGRVGFSPVFGTAFGAWAGTGAQHGPVAGWFPLGPGEPWHPPYRASGTYLRHVNPGHAFEGAPAHAAAAGSAGAPGLPPTQYRYARVPGASTLVPQSAVTGSLGVWSRRLPVAGAPGAASAQVTTGAAPAPVPARQPLSRRVAPSPAYPPATTAVGPAREQAVVSPSPQRFAAPQGSTAPPMQQGQVMPMRPGPGPQVQQGHGPPIQQRSGPAMQQGHPAPARQVHSAPVQQANPAPVQPVNSAPMPQMHHAPAPQSPSGPPARGFASPSQGQGAAPGAQPGAQPGGGRHR